MDKVVSIWCVCQMGGAKKKKRRKADILTCLARTCSGLFVLRGGDQINEFAYLCQVGYLENQGVCETACDKFKYQEVPLGESNGNIPRGTAPTDQHSMTSTKMRLESFVDLA